jgi:murein DD-endopeptidase MepM/ murein hydrolase activator NlpD
MNFTSPIDAPFTPLRDDKFGVVRPYETDPSLVPHTGVDLRPHGNGGTRNVLAIADGVIVVSRGDQGSYYSVDHGEGFFSLYVHINRTLPVGTRVKQGQIIATYLPTYNHLHFMIREGGNTDAFNKNPENYINFSNPHNINPMDKQLIQEFANGNFSSTELKQKAIEANAGGAEVTGQILIDYQDNAEAYLDGRLSLEELAKNPIFAGLALRIKELSK